MKRTLKVLSLLFAVALIAALFSVATFAADATKVILTDANGVETVLAGEPAEVKIPQGSTLSYHGYEITNKVEFGKDELTAKIQTIPVDKNGYTSRYALGTYTIETDNETVTYTGKTVDKNALEVRYDFVPANVSDGYAYTAVSTDKTLASVDAGEYDNEAVVLVKINGYDVPAEYFVGKTNFGKLTINKASLTVTVKGKFDGMFTGNTYKPAVTVKANGVDVTADAKIEYSSNQGATDEKWSTDIATVSYTNYTGGEKTISVRVTYTDNYNVGTGFTTINITKRDLTGATVTLDKTSFVYNSFEQSVNVTGLVTKKFNNTNKALDVFSYIAAGNLVVTGNEAKFVDTYTVTIKPADGEKGQNFENSVTKTWTITRYNGDENGENNITDLVMTGWEYKEGKTAGQTGTKPTANAGSGKDSVEFKYYEDDNGKPGTAIDNPNDVTNAGTYWVEAYVAPSKHTMGSTESAYKSFTIEKSKDSATWNIKVAQDGTVSYTGVTETAFATIIDYGTMPANVTVSSTSGFSWSTKNAGTKAMTATLVFENYADVTCDWTAEMKKAVVTIKVPTWNVIYDGTTFDVSKWNGQVKNVWGNKTIDVTLPTLDSSVTTPAWVIGTQDNKGNLLKSIKYEGSIAQIKAENINKGNGVQKITVNAVLWDTYEKNFEVNVVYGKVTDTLGGYIVLAPKTVDVEVRSEKIPYDGKAHAMKPTMTQYGEWDASTSKFSLTAAVQGDFIEVVAKGDITATNVPTREWDASTKKWGDWLGDYAKGCYLSVKPEYAKSDLVIKATDANGENISACYKIGHVVFAEVDGVKAEWVNIVPQEVTLQVEDKNIVYGNGNKLTVALSDLIVVGVNGKANNSMKLTDFLTVYGGEYGLTYDYGNTIKLAKTYEANEFTVNGTNTYEVALTTVKNGNSSTPTFALTYEAPIDNEGKALAEGVDPTEFQTADVVITESDVTGNVKVRAKTLAIVVANTTVAYGTDENGAKDAIKNNTTPLGIVSGDEKLTYNIAVALKGYKSDVRGSYGYTVTATPSDTTIAENYILAIEYGTFAVGQRVVYLYPQAQISVYGTDKEFAKIPVADAFKASNKNRDAFDTALIDLTDDDNVIAKAIKDAGIVLSVADYTATTPVNSKGYSITVSIPEGANDGDYKFVVAEAKKSNKWVEATATLTVQPKPVILVINAGEYVYGTTPDFDSFKKINVYEYDATTGGWAWEEDEDGKKTPVAGLVGEDSLNIQGAEYKVKNGQGNDFVINYIVPAGVTPVYNNNYVLANVDEPGTTDVIELARCGVISMENAEIAGSTFDYEAADLKYTGDDQKLFTVKNVSVTMADGKVAGTVEYSYAINGGTKVPFAPMTDEVKATAVGDHKVEVFAKVAHHEEAKIAEFTVTIKPLDVIVMFNKDSVYSGKEQGPDIGTVIVDGKVLKDSEWANTTDTYTNAGTYDVTIQIKVGEKMIDYVIKWTIAPFVIDRNYLTWYDAGTSALYTKNNGGYKIAVTLDTEELAKKVTLETDEHLGFTLSQLPNYVGTYEINVSGFDAQTTEETRKNFELDTFELGSYKFTVLSNGTPAFGEKNVSVKEDYTVKFRVNTLNLVQYGPDAEVRFSREGAADFVWSGYNAINDLTTEGNNSVFAITGIKPHEMGKTIVGTITVNGKVVDTIEYSIATYCYNIMTLYDATTNWGKIMVSMLRYGAAAQKYMNSNVLASDLVTARLDTEAAFAAHKALDTEADSYAGTKTIITYKTDKVTAGVAPSLNNGVKLTVSITPKTEGGAYVLYVNGEEQNVTFEEKNGSLVAQYTIPLYNVNDVYRYEIKDTSANETVVDMLYSVENYASSSTAANNGLVDLSERLSDFARYLSVLY